LEEQILVVILNVFLSGFETKSVEAKNEFVVYRNECLNSSKEIESFPVYFAHYRPFLQLVGHHRLNAESRWLRIRNSTKFVPPLFKPSASAVVLSVFLVLPSKAMWM
jgi:hypothetical protein